MLNCYFYLSEYDVENIWEKKMMNGVVHYHLKWKGFPSSDNSWEPEANISKDLLDCFNAEKLN